MWRRLGGVCCCSGRDEAACAGPGASCGEAGHATAAEPLIARLRAVGLPSAERDAYMDEPAAVGERPPAPWITLRGNEAIGTNNVAGSVVVGRMQFDCGEAVVEAGADPAALRLNNPASPAESARCIEPTGAAGATAGNIPRLVAEAG